MKKKIRVTASLFILLLLAACSTKEVEKTNETADEAPVNAAELVESPILPENCSHPSWTNEHICTVCGYACGHEVWINGVCALCGAVCEHPAHDAETQLCTICGAKTWHSFYHGLCACGAKPDLRENYLEPAEYFVDQEQQGTIEYVPYRAGNYFYEDGPDYFDKELIVYLPYDYDDTNQYDVVLFIHGTGGTPNDFMTREIDYYGPHPKVRGVDLYDYIFANKLAKPMILVSISAKAILGGSHATEMSTKQIGQEIRDDILPCIVEHFSTYAADSSAESIRDARQHFCLCGISTGSIFAIDSGIIQNYDLFGNYICLSGDGRTNEAVMAMNSAEWSELPIYYFYSGAGTIDIRSLSALHTYQYMIGHSDRLTENENAMHVFVDGGHKWSVWFTSLYNAMQLIFPVAP